MPVATARPSISGLMMLLSWTRIDVAAEYFFGQNVPSRRPSAAMIANSKTSATRRRRASTHSISGNSLPGVIAPLMTMVGIAPVSKCPLRNSDDVARLDCKVRRQLALLHDLAEAHIERLRACAFLAIQFGAVRGRKLVRPT